MNRGIITAEASGTGGIKTLHLEITSSHKMEIIIPAGTLFTSSAGGSQSMMAASTVRFVFQGGSSPETQTRDIEVYCINRWLDIPSPNVTFRISGGEETNPVRKLVACLEGEDAPHEARQLAVWVVSDNLWDLSPAQLADKFTQEQEQHLGSLDVEQIITEARDRGAITEDEAAVLRQAAHDDPEGFRQQWRSAVEDRSQKEVAAYVEAAAPLLTKCGYDLSGKALFQKEHQ